VEIIIEGAVRLGMPLVLAGLAGLLAERSGVLNIALEGFMLGGAFAAAWAAGGDGFWLVGLLAAVAFGLLSGATLGWVMVAWRADQVVVGIAFNVLAFGLTSYLFGIVTRSGQQAVSVEKSGIVAIPGLADIPYVGSALFEQHVIGYVGFLLVPIVYYVLFRTGLGVRIRASGEFSEGATAVGVNVLRLRVLVMAASGALAAVGGAYLVLAHARIFIEGMTAGRGYIALAIIILGRWRPLGVLGAGILVGAADALQLQLQAGGLDIPIQLAFAFPYLVTLVAVALLGRRVRPPAEEGRPLPWRG
jgi:general nucleoside transport system permease protein